MKVVDNTAEFIKEDRYTELMLGCGHLREKRLTPENQTKEFQNLVTCDINPSVNPDVLCDLNDIPWPFQDEEFDEIHAYEILEHLGYQGDYKSFFDHFNELYRILKPGGHLLASVPAWDKQWAWGDPGHRRVITEGTLLFLDQDNYNQPNNPMTNYLSMGLVKCDFRVEGLQEAADSLYFVLSKKHGDSIKRN